MSEKEKNIIRTLKKALPQMSEREQGYFLGYAEALAASAKKPEEEKEEEKDEAANKGA